MCRLDKIGKTAGAVIAAALMLGMNVQGSGRPEMTADFERMTLEEKVAQLFFIAPDALTGEADVQTAGQVFQESFHAYPVGGIILFENNIASRGQLTEMLQDMQEVSMERLNMPLFLATDEEGGRVRRISGVIEEVPEIESMLSIGETGDSTLAYRTGQEIGSYLVQLGFNLDFAPVADVYSNPENTVIGDRAFGTDAETVSAMVSEMVKGMNETGMLCTLKHFPGHGDTQEDSHDGYAASYKTMEELENCEILPFQAGIKAGAQFVMAAHISLPNVTKEEVPADLSYEILTKLLREKLGFSGIIITDALGMGAIAEKYSSGDAAVKALLAGADMLLMPADFKEAYEAVLAAVQNGTLKEERINESARRIWNIKKNALCAFSDCRQSWCRSHTPAPLFGFAFQIYKLA